MRRKKKGKDRLMEMVRLCLDGTPKEQKERLSYIEYAASRTGESLVIQGLSLNQKELFRVCSLPLIRLSCYDMQSVPGDAIPALLLEFNL